MSDALDKKVHHTLDAVNTTVADTLLSLTLYYVDSSDAEREAVLARLSKRVCPECAGIFERFFDEMTTHALTHREKAQEKECG